MAGAAILRTLNRVARAASEPDTATEATHPKPTRQAREPVSVPPGSETARPHGRPHVGPDAGTRGQHPPLPPRSSVAEQRTTPATITEALTKATQCIEWAQDEEPGHRADHLLNIAEAWQSLAATISEVTAD